MIKIDAKGKICPVPVIEARNAIKAAEKDETILVVVDNEIAKENLEKMAKEMGHKWSSQTVNEGHYEVEIIKGLGSAELIKDLVNEKKENTLIVISSDKMGQGNEELGEILIKGFIYALAEGEQIPSSIIFYNGGVKLSTKQSSTIESLKKLENLGVEILSCGTCLNYYNLTDELAVGQITNMYTILEKMNTATKLLNLDKLNNYGFGYGRRMGQDKLFLLFKGKTLIEHTIDKVKSCDFYSTAVVARDERILNLAIQNGFKAIKNNNADLGQSESIKLGLNNVPKAEGYMFFTADQPLLNIETIKLLTSTFEKNKNSIIVPRYKGQNGSPVIFPFEFIDELKKLQGDRGGRGVIKEHIDQVIHVEVKNQYMLMDVDTIEDYERILKDYEKIIDIKG